MFLTGPEKAPPTKKLFGLTLQFFWFRMENKICIRLRPPSGFQECIHGHSSEILVHKKGPLTANKGEIQWSKSQIKMADMSQTCLEYVLYCGKMWSTYFTQFFIYLVYIWLLGEGARCEYFTFFVHMWRTFQLTICRAFLCIFPPPLWPVASI